MLFQRLGNLQRNKLIFFFLLLFVVIVGFFFSLAIGAKSSIFLSTVFSSLFSFDGSIDHEVVRSIRLPRSSAAFLVGVNLSLAGLALQAITRNSLASPSLLGIHQGASFGIALGLVVPGLLIINSQFMALFGACLGGFLTFTFAGGPSGRLVPIRLILAGVAVSAFSMAMVRFTFLLEDNLARQIIQWTAGDISDMRWQKLGGLVYWTCAGVSALFLLSHKFNLLSLDEGSLRGLGISPLHTRFLGAAIGALLTGVSVSVSGPIMFVGLMVPHLARSLFGRDHRILVPVVALMGGGLLVFADGISKLINFPYETPVGIVCALIGAPYFVYQTVVTRDMG